MTSSDSFGRRDALAPRVAFRGEPTYAPPRPAFVASAEPATGRTPWVALGLIGLFTAIYFGERAVAFDHGAIFSYHTIVAVGGVDRHMVIGQGQWWRLLTAPLLHGGLSHLLGNVAVMALVGFGLEPLIGRGWFAAIFAFGALVGAVASMAVNPSWVVSVGASGGIMALLTASYVCSFHPEAFESGARMRWWVYRLAIPALVPFGAAGGATIDYSCHIGGAFAGMGFGYLLQFLWAEANTAPPLRRQAAKAAAGIGVAACVAFALVAFHFPGYAARQASLIPEDAIPRNDAEALDRSETFVLEYPQDPRGHFLRALAAARDEDVPTMEREARTGLAERDILARDYPPAVALELQGVLALALAAENRPDEARPLAQSVCEHAAALAEAKGVVEQLRTESLCA